MLIGSKSDREEEPKEGLNWGDEEKKVWVGGEGDCGIDGLMELVWF